MRAITTPSWELFTERFRAAGLIEMHERNPDTNLAAPPCLEFPPLFDRPNVEPHPARRISRFRCHDIARVPHDDESHFDRSLSFTFLDGDR